MNDMSNQLGPCPRCGGRSVIDSYSFKRDGGTSVEIHCSSCGLTLNYDTDVVYTSNNLTFEVGGNISWSYKYSGQKSVLDIWHEGVDLTKGDKHHV